MSFCWLMVLRTVLWERNQPTVGHNVHLKLEGLRHISIVLDSLLLLQNFLGHSILHAEVLSEDFWGKSLDFKMWRNRREKKYIELVNLMKHSEDQLLFYCGGSQKPSQRVVWVHVRVSSFTAEAQTWQWRQLPLWVAISFLIWLMTGTVLRTGVAGNYMTHDIRTWIGLFQVT